MTARAEILRAAVLALAAALAVVLLAPPGGDSAAHLYRTMLVRDGVTVWDNLWYGGQYPLASYSLLYYLPAAVVGNVPLVILAVVASAALFAAVVTHEWGEDARWPARAFGLLAAGPLFTGTYSYAAGLAAALACLRLLQLRRPWLAVAAAGLTLGFSPLAFAFLCVVLVAVAAARRPSRRQACGRRRRRGGAWPSSSSRSSPSSRARAATRSARSRSRRRVTVSALGAALAWRAERGRLIAPFFVLWALVCLGAFLVPSPFGDNLTRLRGGRVPARAARRGARALPAAAGSPPRRSPSRSPTTSAPTSPRCRSAPTTRRRRARRTGSRRSTSWRRSDTADHRVEVVPTFGHWEAWWVPREGYALARGWFRQIDLAENPELYDDPLDAGCVPALARPARRALGAAARRPARADGRRPRGRAAPLRRLGPAACAPLGALDGLRGARARPAILDGGTLTRFDHEAIAGTVGRGRHLLRVRWNRYWRVASGAVCLEPATGRADDPRGSRGRAASRSRSGPAGRAAAAVIEPQTFG